MSVPTLPEVTAPEPGRRDRQLAFVQDVATSAAVVMGWFAVVGLIGALIWVKVTPLPEFTRIAGSGTMDEEQLAKQFSVNGWFFVIALVGGLLSGLVITVLRRRSNPLVVVGLVALGGGLATLLMLQFGLMWGPGDPNEALAAAQVGDAVPVQLKPDAHGIYYAWSIGALVGATLAIWVLDARDRSETSVYSGPDRFPFSG